MSIILFLISFSIYLIALAPTIYFGDSAEFATTSYLLDIPHPPSYPLYNLLCKLFNYIPLYEPATRTNLSAAFFAALTTIFIYFIIGILPINMKREVRISFSFIAAILFSFSYTFYLQSIKAEVYTLYVLLFCIIIYLLLKYDAQKDIRYIYLAAFVFGLSLCNHPLILLSITTIIYFIITSTKKVFTLKNIIIISFIIIIQSIFYSYLPLRSAKEVEINWGRPQQFSGFMYIVSLEEQGKLFEEAPPEKETWIKEPATSRISTNVLLVNLFLFLLPLYFSFLMKSKIDYSRYRKFTFVLIIFLIISSLLFAPFPYLYFKAPEYVRNTLLKIAQLFFYDILNILNVILLLGLILFFILFSFTEKTRKKLIPIILTITFLLAIFAYCFLLYYTPGYQQHRFSQFIFLNLFIKQFTMYGFILGIVGIFYFLFHNLRIATFFYFLFLSYSVLIITLIYPDYLPQLQEMFCLPAYLIFSIFIVFGLKLIIDYITLLVKYKFIVPFLLTIFIIFSFIPLITHFKYITKTNYYFAKYYTDDILFTLPKNAIILSKGIDTTFTLWYRLFVEKKRKDIDIVYIDALSQKWYIDNLKATTSITIPELNNKLETPIEKVNAYVRNIIRHNSATRPIYYSGSALFIVGGIEKGTAIPEGILFKIVKTKRRPTLKEIDRTKHLLYEGYKFPRKVATAEEGDIFTRGIINIYAASHYKLALHYVQLNRITAAIKELKKAIDLDKNCVYCFTKLAELYLSRNKVNEAMKILHLGIKYNKNAYLLYYTLGKINFELGYINEAKKYLEKVIELEDEFLPAYFGLVNIYLMIPDSEKVKTLLNKILEIQPDNKEAKELLHKLF